MLFDVLSPANLNPNFLSLWKFCQQKHPFGLHSQKHEGIKSTRYGEQTPNVDVTPSPHELKVSRPQVMSMSMIVIRIIVTVMM